MSEDIGTSSNSDLEVRTSLDPRHRIQRTSTPVSNRIRESFLPPPDLSDVPCYTSGSSSTTGRRGRRKNPVARPRSSSNPTPRKSNLGELVAERLRTSSVRKSLSHAFNKLTVCNEEINDSSSSIEDGPATKKLKVARKGQEWEVFKPKHKDGIFAKVVNQPYNTLEEAEKWLNLYVKNVPKAINAFLQFCVDICGYQDLDVSRIFKLEEQNYIALRDFMQQDPPEYQKKTGKYLMKSSATWCKQSQNAIFTFVKQLLEAVYNNNRFCDGVFIKHILATVTLLICSHSRSMHHTGVVLIAKMYTVFLEIEVDVQRKVEISRIARFDSEQSNAALVNHVGFISELLKKVQMLIEEHFCIKDPDLDQMEVTILEEMFDWFKLNPSLLSTSKFFKRLLVCVEDQSKRVRSAALTVCHKILKEPTLVNHFEPLIVSFVKTVEGRVRDVENGIASDATYICTDIIREYPNAISATARDRLMMLVYCENYNLAVAAGSVLNEVLLKYCITDGGEDSAKYIQCIIKCSHLDTEDYIALLVEALLRHSPKLNDWNTMIELLLNDDLDFDEQRQLIHIMSHAVQQSTTGKCKIPRAKTIQGRPNLNRLRKTWNTFLANLHPLIRKFSTHPKSVQMLCEILLVIDYNETSLAKHLNHVIALIKIIQEIFIKSIDRELLETLTAVLTKLCDDISIFKNRTAGLVEFLHKAVVNALYNSIEDLNQNDSPPEDTLWEIEMNSLKLSILLPHQDLAELIEKHIFGWFKLESMVTTEAMKNILSCGHWYMIWTLRNIVKIAIQTEPSEDLEEYINSHKSTVSEYIKICFNFLRHSESFRIRTEAFECICKIHINLIQEIRNPMNTNEKLKELLLDELKNDQLTMLMTFANQLLFEEKERTARNIRRICLGHVLNLTILNIIPLQKLPEVYMHYELHKADYIDIFNNVLKKHQAISGCARAAILLKTLIYTYGSTDLKQIEARDQLRRLAKAFRLIVSRSADDIKLILQLGINYAVGSVARYAFLYYLKYFFIPSAATTYEESILTFFEAKIPRGQEDHKAIVDFKAYLQSNQRTESVRQQRLANTSSNNSEMEGTIEYDSQSVSSSTVETYTIEDDWSDAI